MLLPATLIVPLLSGVAILTLIYAALRDVAVRLIPNRLCLLTLACGLGLRAQAAELLPGLAAGLAIFVFGFVIWWFGFLGGGDVKLLAAAATVTAPGQVLDLVLLTAILGGVLAGVFLFGRRALRDGQPSSVPASLPRRILRVEARRMRRGGPLPYGVAISAAAILLLVGG